MKYACLQTTIHNYILCLFVLVSQLLVVAMFTNFSKKEKKERKTIIFYFKKLLEVIITTISPPSFFQFFTKCVFCPFHCPLHMHTHTKSWNPRSSTSYYYNTHKYWISAWLTFLLQRVGSSSKKIGSLYLLDNNQKDWL